GAPGAGRSAPRRARGEGRRVGGGPPAARERAAGRRGRRPRAGGRARRRGGDRGPRGARGGRMARIRQPLTPPTAPPATPVAPRRADSTLAWHVDERAPALATHARAASAALAGAVDDLRGGVVAPSKRFPEPESGFVRLSGHGRSVCRALGEP